VLACTRPVGASYAGGILGGVDGIKVAEAVASAWLAGVKPGTPRNLAPPGRWSCPRQGVGGYTK
jgi:hypothetical protein